jgi:hypothetical protein
LEVDGEFDLGVEGGGGEVVGEAARRSVFGAKGSFERLEDITTLPDPMQAVQIPASRVSRASDMII